jgi:type IV pilus assembly protein PilW
MSARGGVHFHRGAPGYRVATRERRSRGFTLVELMIALAIGLLTIAVALEMYARASDIYRLNERVARLQEQGRVALSMIEPDVELAGFYGFTQLADAIRFTRGSNPDITLATAAELRQFPFVAGGPLPAAVAGLPAGAHACGVNFAVDVSMPVQGSNDVFALGRSPGSCNPYQGRAREGADTLTLRRVGTQSAAPEANRLQIYASRLTSGSSQLMFADGNAPGPIDENHEVHDLMVRTYYIARDSVGQRDFPALRMKTLTRSGAGVLFDEDEVMAGIEDLQVQFGISAAGARDGRAARYVDPDAAGVGDSQVVSVRLWLRVRADLPEPSFQDDRTYRYANVTFTPAGTERHYRRALMTRTVALRNARVT